MEIEKQKALAKSLYERQHEGVIARYEKVRLGDREAELGKCHENVDARVADHPEESAVRGWLWKEEKDNGYVKFGAHSVIERNKEPLEITYPDCRYVFIRHPAGTVDFMEFVRQKIPEILHVFDRERFEVFLEACKQNLLAGAGIGGEGDEFY